MKDLERRVKNLENIVFSMIDCDTCEFNNLTWRDEPCSHCCMAHSGYKKADTPKDGTATANHFYGREGESK